MLQMVGINIGEKIYKQQVDPIIYPILFTILILVNFWVSNPLATGFAIWYFLVSKVLSSDAVSTIIHDALSRGRKVSPEQRNKGETAVGDITKYPIAEEATKSEQQSTSSIPVAAPVAGPVAGPDEEENEFRKFRRLRFRPPHVMV